MTPVGPSSSRHETNILSREGGSGVGGSASPLFTDIIVAVHGIGDQKHAATVRSVATRMAGSTALLKQSSVAKDDLPRLLPVAPQPLGHFNTGESGVPALVDRLPILKDTPLEKIGFAEVFWANIPQEILEEGRTLEETKEWARTVVARAQSLCKQAVREKRPGIIEPDFSLASEVLDEVIDTVYVLENLTYLADKAGLGSFDVAGVLEQYLGDVQIVAEFATHRKRIVATFREIMEGYYNAQRAAGNPNVRLHVVAHSEGTVVSFLGLLEAMSEYPTLGTPVSPEVRARLAWLEHLRGYMTIGSPIDKHLLLWPRLWENLSAKNANAVLPPGQIAWRNYYDFGDPVGFELNTARRWLDLTETRAFEFCACPKCKHDLGFARYPLPGKAHNDYWEDAEVFEHFITDVVLPAGSRPLPPKSRFVGRISPLVPYAVSAVILTVASWILYKAVTGFTYPERDSFAALTITRELGIELSAPISGAQLAQHSAALASLLAGVTLLARLPRLAVGGVWKLIGAAAFAAGGFAYWRGVAKSSRDEIGHMFARFGEEGPTLGVLALALVVALGALAISHAGSKRPEDRRRRLFLRGMRPLLFCGALGVGWIVGAQVLSGEVELTPAQLEQIDATRQEALRAATTPAEREKANALPNETLSTITNARFTTAEVAQLFGQDGVTARLRNLVAVAPAVSASPPIWPVALATAGFLYLWWLSALIFDLAFVWQRYVRGSVVVERLGQWTGVRIQKRREKWWSPKVEACRNPVRKKEQMPVRA